MYTYYCYDALIQQNTKEIFKKRFGIAESTYSKVFREPEAEDMLVGLLTARNKFDICHEVETPDEFKDLPEELRIAIDYEMGYHPDDLLFVTADEEMAKLAGCYFGEDSIKLINKK